MLDRLHLSTTRTTPSGPNHNVSILPSPPLSQRLAIAQFPFHGAQRCRQEGRVRVRSRPGLLATHELCWPCCRCPRPLGAQSLECAQTTPPLVPSHALVESLAVQISEMPWETQDYRSFPPLHPRNRLIGHTPCQR